MYIRNLILLLISFMLNYQIFIYKFYRVLYLFPTRRKTKSTYFRKQTDRNYQTRTAPKDSMYLLDSLFPNKFLPGRHWTCIFSPWWIFERLSMPYYITRGYIQILLYKWVVMRYLIRFVFVSDQTENKIYVFSKTNGQELSDAYSPEGLNVSSIAIYTDENQYINSGIQV
jgi:hypothetical protein